ncbi:hypothetical protein [Catenulispora subtropica]|uniref:Alpha/beta hydrolase n=1 Tax=Catenulispora subtropica TaxID=450798 RepID=A0ABP5EU90_9ACTN
MAPRIVFVHGIGGLRDPSRDLAAWTEALALGCRDAGHSRFARQLREGATGAVFAYYGDLFYKSQAQGDGFLDLDDEEAELLATFLAGILDEQLSTDDPDTDRPALDAETVRLLKRARSQLSPAGQTQGSGQILRHTANAITTLLSIRPLRKGGQWTLSKTMIGHLSQVARYLARKETDTAGRPLDQRIRARVADALKADSAIVVAHSLGSVVAWEALHEADTPVPLFVTLGSPLATRTAVWPRLYPQPPSTPECVGRWLNFWDRDDLVVARPRLEKDIVPNSAGVGPRSQRVDSDGLWVHSAVKYLRQARVAGRIAEAVQTPAGVDDAG